MRDATQLDVRPLKPGDDTSNFHCGEGSLDLYLQRYALSAQQSGGPRTYVAVADDDSIVGYYSLVSDSMEREKAPERLAAGTRRGYGSLSDPPHAPCPPGGCPA